MGVDFENLSKHNIQTLPDDILILIFLYAGPSQIRDDIPKVSSVFPMNLSLVCHSWWALVATQPSLWSGFHANIHTAKPLHGRLSRLVESWLQKSSPALLSFRISIFAGGASRDSVVEAITSQLLSQAHRWKDVELNIRYTHMRSFLDPIRLPDMPSLRSLWIALDECYGSLGHDEGSVSVDLSRCYQLKTLTVRFGLKLRLVGQESIFLDRLSNLSLCVDASVFEDFRKVLAASINLVDLDVALTGISTCGEGTSLEGSISLMNLRHINLVDDNHALATHFLGLLTCPKLQSLSSENTYSADSADTPDAFGITLNLLSAFDKLFHRSRPPLSRLQLEYGIGRGRLPASNRGCSSILRRILGNLHVLEVLRVDGVAMDDPLIQAMIARDSEPDIVCPSLEELHFAVYGEDDTVPLSTTLGDFIVSRWRPGKTLKYFTLDVDDPDKLQMLLESSEVKQCVEEGFLLYVQ